MGARPFAGIQSLSGSAQPVFGTTLTAAVTPPPDPFSGNLNPGSNQTQVKIAVTSTVGFRAGDNVAIGPGTSFKPGIATAALDVGVVKSVVDSTHLLVQDLTKSHASGEFCVLSAQAGSVQVCPVGGTAADAIYLGNASTVGASDPSVIDVLAVPTKPGQETYFHNSQAIGTTQALNTTEYWIIGTASDTFVARFTEV